MKNVPCLFLFAIATVFSFCSKSNTNGGSSAPENLTVNAVVNADSSGNVSFTASATNAVSYEYDLGNGIYKTSTSGSLDYKYSASGNYTVNVTAKSAGGQTASKSIQVKITLTASFAWSDEFDNNGAPDQSKWGYDLGAGGWGNGELQYYTNRPENVYVSNGTLKIVAKKESYGGSAYTSARLLTKGKYSFTYGKVEFRAKLPAGGGSWPALWMLGAAPVTWPACGEIDVMEQKGNEVNRIYGTLHYPGHSGGNGNGSSTVISNATTDFHIYSAEWTPAFIKISVDNVVYHTVANNGSLPFNADFFLIMNVAMGGAFGGAVDPAFTSATMEVDYVRVYK